MSKTLDNDAANSSTAKTRLERAEQALTWALWELGSDNNGHGGVENACEDIYPELTGKRKKSKKYSNCWPDSYDREQQKNS